MKKISFLAALLLTFVSANGINCISLGDTVRVNPNKLGGYTMLAAEMTIDGMCDNFSMEATYPQGFSPKLVAGIVAFDDMAINYLDRNGQEVFYTPPLQVSAAYGNISATSTEMGWWDYNQDGYLESYGTAKWMPGQRQIFALNMAVSYGFREGYITFDGILTSGPDQRGAVLQGVRFYSRTWVWVGLQPGDITGNEMITVGDIADLVDMLLGSIRFDEFQRKAADVNFDGEVNIADVSTLIDWLL